MKDMIDVYKRAWRESEKTAGNGWIYDERFGAKIQICEFPVQAVSFNTE